MSGPNGYLLEVGLNESLTTYYPPADALNERIQQALWLAILGGTAITLNSIPIALTILTDLRQNKVNIIIANLASADIVGSASFAVGQAVYVIFWGQLSMTGCHLLAFLAYFAAYAEYFLSPILAVNRYVSLYHNEKYDQIYSGRNIALMTISSWLLSTVVPMILWIFGKTGYDYDNMHCCIVIKKTDVFWQVFYWLFLTVPLLALSAAPMTFCNYKIYKKLWAHASTAKNLNGNNVVQQNKEIFYFLIADTIPPVMIQTIYHVGKMVLSGRTDPVLKRLFIQLYMINYLIRGAIILIFLRPFRQAAKDAFRCAFRKKNAIAPTAEENPDDIRARPEATFGGTSWNNSRKV